MNWGLILEARLDEVAGSAGELELRAREVRFAMAQSLTRAITAKRSQRGREHAIVACGRSTHVSRS